MHALFTSANTADTGDEQPALANGPVRVRGALFAAVGGLRKVAMPAAG